MSPANVLQWNDRLSVGVPDLDGQHRGLIEQVGAIQSAMSGGRGRNVIEAMLRNLVEAARDHFLTEETQLAQAGYPDLELHRAQHDGLLRRLEELHGRFHSGPFQLTVALVTMLGEWIETHIVTYDLKYAPHLAGRSSP